MLCYRFDTLSPDDLCRAQALIPLWSSLGLSAEALGQAFSCLQDAPDAERIEYNRLFFSPVPLVPLWESLWLSDEGVLFTQETSSVRDWYRRFGQGILREGYEAEDHVGLELAFCGQLYDAAARDGALLEELAAFASAHACRWVPQCLAALRDAAESPFWRPVLEAICAVVTALCGELAANGTAG